PHINRGAAFNGRNQLATLSGHESRAERSASHIPRSWFCIGIPRARNLYVADGWSGKGLMGSSATECGRFLMPSPVVEPHQRNPRTRLYQPAPYEPFRPKALQRGTAHPDAK